MLEALGPASIATALIEVDTPADEQELTTNQIETLDLRWLHRLGRSAPGDASLLLEAVGDVDLPTGRGHVYAAAESRVHAVQQALTARGSIRTRSRPRPTGAEAYRTPSEASPPARPESTGARSGGHRVTGRSHPDFDL